MAGTPTTLRSAAPAARQADVYTLTDWGLLAGTALIWGSSFLFIAVGLDTIAPPMVTLLRLVFGAATLALIPKARRALPRSEWPRLFVLGALWMGIPFLLFPYAQQWIDSSLAGMLNGAVPLFTAAVATLVARRLPGGRQVAGLLLGFAGVVAVSWPAVQGASATALGTALVVLATICYGIAINLAVPLQQRYGNLPVLLHAEIAAIVITAPVGLTGLTSSTFAPSSLLAVAALGCLGTALAFVGLVTLVSRVGATRASITIYFTPVVAIALGVAFLQESVAVASLIGTALVLGGAWLVSRRDVKASQPATQTAAEPAPPPRVAEAT